MPTYDDVAAYFDRLGDGEWERLVGDVRGRVSLELHRRFLGRFVRAEMRVLEVGAGAGRFTVALAELGCRVVVGDVSEVQLELNERHVREVGRAEAVESRCRLDVIDLSEFADDSFDAVVAYGGPLSYTFDHADQAFAECLRVTGGVVVASVMSLPGSARHFLESFPATIDAVGLDEFDAFLGHGDQRRIEAAGAHPCRLFTSRDVERLVERGGGELVAASASNWLSLGPAAVVDALAGDAELWARFLDWEERLCSEPGTVDGGTHLLFAARRLPPRADARVRQARGHPIAGFDATKTDQPEGGVEADAPAR